MKAQVIQFPPEVREEVAMARLVQRACSRMGWNVELQDAVSAYRGSRNVESDPALDAIARKVASELGITLKPGTSL